VYYVFAEGKDKAGEGIMAIKPKHSQKDILTIWRENPLEWVRAFFGDAILKAQMSRGIQPRTETGLSMQQEAALIRWGKLIRAKYRKGKGLSTTEEEDELATKIGMSIQSSNGNGKDFLAALINWHFMSTCPMPKVIATANTGKQLKSVYWSELAKIRSMATKLEDKIDSLNRLQIMFEMQSETAFANIPNKDERGKRWFTEAVTINVKATPEEQGEALAGRHEDFMLIIVDEASGIPDAVFKPLERTLTGLVNLCFMIFNPTKNTGYAIDSHKKYRDKWECIQWDALNCENIQQSQIDALRKYGEDSPAYRIGVLGLPPLSDSDALIPFEWVQEAINRELIAQSYDPYVAGLDVGGGGDKSVLIIRQAGNVQSINTYNEADTMKTVEWASAIINREEVSCTAVDIIGLGRGVFDRMRQLGCMVKSADSRGKPSKERFLNVRAEMYWRLREQFENKTISIPDDPELVNELSAIKSEFSGNKIKIRDKKEIRKEFGFSPDRADSLAMSFMINDDAYRRGQRKQYKSIDYRRVQML
jgi:phage terminase large subunit